MTQPQPQPQLQPSKKIKGVALGVFVIAVLGAIISLWLPWVFLFKNRSLFSLLSTAKELQTLDQLKDLEKINPFAFAYYLFPFLTIAGLLLLFAGKKIYGFALSLLSTLCIGVTGILFYMTVDLQIGAATSIVALAVAILSTAVFFVLDRR